MTNLGKLALKHCRAFNDDTLPEIDKKHFPGSDIYDGEFCYIDRGNFDSYIAGFMAAVDELERNQYSPNEARWLTKWANQEVQEAKDE